jgi:beta-glucosidase
VQFVQGIQGDDPFYRKADATQKHFAAHSGPEQGRDSFNSIVSAHDLAVTYLPAFHALAALADGAAIMCSYNAINGTPSCANATFLQDRVRDLSPNAYAARWTGDLLPPAPGVYTLSVAVERC